MLWGISYNTRKVARNSGSIEFTKMVRLYKDASRLYETKYIRIYE